MSHTTLVLIAHGSRSASWVAAVNDLVHSMNEEVQRTDGPFDRCAVAYLENAAPSIDDVLGTPTPHAGAGAPEEAQAPVPVALPLLLTASAHLREDVPAEVKGRARVLTPLDPGRWLAANLRRRLDGMRGQHELGQIGVVMVAYGSSEYGSLWTDMLDGVQRRLEQSGVAVATHAFVGHVVGLSPDPTFEAVCRLANGRKDLSAVAVLPVLFARGMLQSGPIKDAADRARRMVQGRLVSILYEGDAILPDPALGTMLLDYAAEAVAEILG